MARKEPSTIPISNWPPRHDISSMSDIAATDEIVELLSVPELRRLLDGARRRLEQSASLTASFTISEPDDAERRAIGRLLATRPPTGRHVRVRLDRLDAALASSRFGVGLVEALQLVGGPVADRRAARVAAALAKEALWERLAAHPALETHPELAEWLGRLRSTGIAARIAPGEESELITAALEIVGCLPRSGDRLNVVAASFTGDAHALDRGTPLGALVVNALAHLAQIGTPSTAADRRSLWASFGVVCDELSCDVLTLGLQPISKGSVASPLLAMKEEGQPLRLTLRHIATDKMAFSPTKVFVCENPVLVAESADVLGSSSPPIICTEGVPNTAMLLLLEQLSNSGCGLIFHGDFDWGGVRIFNHIRRKIDEITPWRFQRADYIRSLERVSVVSNLEGKPIETDWDPSLQQAMIDQGRAVFEEQVLGDLIGDLRSADPG
jgi:uncharacterized protein (TIGR02679 family)